MAFDFASELVVFCLVQLFQVALKFRELIDVEQRASFAFNQDLFQMWLQFFLLIILTTWVTEMLNEAAIFSRLVPFFARVLMLRTSEELSFDREAFSPSRRLPKTFLACLSLSAAESHSRFEAELSFRFPFLWFTQRASGGGSKKVIATSRWTGTNFLSPDGAFSQTRR